jgi:hypothetical protein
MVDGNVPNENTPIGGRGVCSSVMIYSLFGGHIPSGLIFVILQFMSVNMEVSIYG